MLHITKINPLFTNIVTTADKFDKDDVKNGVILASKGDMKVWQTVIAVGSMVRDINVGDKVMINIANYAVRRFSKDSIQNDMDNNPTLKYAFNWVTIDDENGNPKDCLLLTDRDILYTFEGEERDDSLIKPAKPSIIV